MKAKKAANTNYDHAVIGGSINGVLAAATILKTNPNARILILEKFSELGGKYRSYSSKLDIKNLKTFDNSFANKSLWGYGYNLISNNLVDLINKTTNIEPDNDLNTNLTELITNLNNFAVFKKNNLTFFGKDKFCHDQIIRNFDDTKPSSSVKKYLNLVKKFKDHSSILPSSNLAHNFNTACDDNFENAHSFFVNDLNLLDTQKLIASNYFKTIYRLFCHSDEILHDPKKSILELAYLHAEFLKKDIYFAKTQSICQTIINNLQKKYQNQLVIFFNSEVNSISYKNNFIINYATNKTIKANNILIACNPWHSSKFIEKSAYDKLTKKDLAKFHNKSYFTNTPCSLICVFYPNVLKNFNFNKAVFYPVMIFMPSYKTQVICFEHFSIFQTFSALQTSLHTNKSISSIKLIKRAAKRLFSYINFTPPHIHTDNNNNYNDNKLDVNLNYNQFTNQSSHDHFKDFHTSLLPMCKTKQAHNYIIKNNILINHQLAGIKTNQPNQQKKATYLNLNNSDKKQIIFCCQSIGNNLTGEKNLSDSLAKIS